MNTILVEDQEKLNQKLIEVIACIKCKGPLKKYNNKFLCPSCNNLYSVQEGVFWASENNYYWGDIDQKQAQQLLKNARKIGWIKALTDLQKKIKNSKFKYYTRANGADWRFNLPLNRHVRVLDVGSGWGQIPFLLAEAYDEIWSLEFIKERIAWQKLRKQQEEVNNLYLVLSNISDMPFLDETFDIISLNGIQQWIGLLKNRVDVHTVQFKILAEAMRLLKPGGYLYIGTKNRIGYDIFMRDIEQSGMSFINLLPRRLSKFYIQHLVKDSYQTKDVQNYYRTYTYTPWGYKKLLTKVGLSNIKFYWVVTSHYNPIAFAPIKEGKKINFYYKQIIPRNLLRKLIKYIYCALIQCGYMRLFSPCLLIYAQKRK
ncbi:MAG: methyltransferase domain-containing protein [Candidatus Hodarchaeota archaeon]